MTPHFLYRSRIHKLWCDIKKALEQCDPDAIHDVRVSIRRMVMLCDVLRGSGRAPYSKEQLYVLKRKFRRAGALRDIQVQRHLLTAWENKLEIHFDMYQQYLERREKSLQQYFIRAFQTINLRNTIPDNVNRISFRRNLEKELNRLEDDFRQKSQSVDFLHPLRITAKKLKYTLEIQQDCYPGFGSTEKFRKYLAHVQDLLGAWHDIEMGIQHAVYFVKRHKMKLGGTGHHDVLNQLLKKEKEDVLLEIRVELDKNIPLRESLSVDLS